MAAHTGGWGQGGENPCALVRIFLWLKGPYRERRWVDFGFVLETRLFWERNARRVVHKISTWGFLLSPRHLKAVALDKLDQPGRDFSTSSL